MSDDMKIYVVTNKDGDVKKCFYSLLDAAEFQEAHDEVCYIQLSVVKPAKKRG